jgi:hypothetical protein
VNFHHTATQLVTIHPSHQGNLIGVAMTSNHRVTAEPLISALNLGCPQTNSVILHVSV